MKKSTIFMALTTSVFIMGLWGYFMLDGQEDSGIFESSFSNRSGIAPDQDVVSELGGGVAKRMAKIENDIVDFKNSSQRGATPDQRIKMARDLNFAYFDSRSESVQRNISSILTHALNEEADLRVVKAIAFSHSRLPFDENTLPNLRSAYKRHALNFDDYFGELAHIYPNAPEKLRGEIVKEIAESNNRYAVDIIAGSIASDENIQISSDEVAVLQRFLTSNEPIFSGPSDAFGYFEAILYADWLLATSRLQFEANGMNMEKFLGIKLLHPDTDPRASIAFLISGYARNLDNSQRAGLQWDAVKARAHELMRQYPDAPGLQAIGKEMAQ